MLYIYIYVYIYMFQVLGAPLWDMEQHKRLVLLLLTLMVMDLNSIPTHGIEVHMEYIFIVISSMVTTKLMVKISLIYV